MTVTVKLEYVDLVSICDSLNTHAATFENLAASRRVPSTTKKIWRDYAKELTDLSAKLISQAPDQEDAEPEELL